MVRLSEQKCIGAAQIELFNTTLTDLLFEPKNYNITTLWNMLSEQSTSYIGKQVPIRCQSS